VSMAETPASRPVTATSNNGPPQPDVYLTTGEVAKLLGISPKTVARWAKEGKLPHLVTLGGHRRFPAEAIYELARKLHFVRS
jgi:excisionase family DNA binding protein